MRLPRFTGKGFPDHFPCGQVPVASRRAPIYPHYRELSAVVTRRSEVEPGSGQAVRPARAEPNLLQKATPGPVQTQLRAV